MLRNKLAVTVIGVATISLVAGGGAGYWIAHQKDNPQSTLGSATGCQSVVLVRPNEA